MKLYSCKGHKQMPAVHSSLLARITVDPEVRFGNPASAATALQFRRFSSGSQAEHRSNRSSPIILNSNRRISWLYMLMLRN